MKNALFGASAIFVIVMLVLASVVVISRDTTWDTPWEDEGTDDSGTTNAVTGSWGQEIIIEYADGTTESLKLACDAPLSIWSGDREIRGIHYKLNAKAEGSASNILYDITEFTYTYKAASGTAINSVVVSCSDYTLSSRPVDGQWHELIKHYTSAEDIIPDTFPPGDYTITVTSSGNIKYEAGSEAKVTATNLPATINFTLLLKADSSVSVSFSSGYDVFE